MDAFSLDRCLETAVKTGASDLYLSPALPPVLRVDGHLRRLEAPHLTPKVVQKTVESITPKTNRRELDAQGQTVFCVTFATQARFRVSVSRTQDGHALALRHIPANPRGFDELGLPPIIKALCRRPRGLFVVAGPADSGRTNVLASMIDYINRNHARRIVTIEHPIEFVHSSQRCVVSQREIGTHTESYETAIGNLRLERADVVLIGDLDEAGAAARAVEVAGADCLVLGHMRGGGAASVIGRLCQVVDHAEPAERRAIVAGTLLAILHTELCRRRDAGLVPAYEFLVTTPAIAGIVRDDNLHRIDAAIQTGAKYGMQRLDDHLFRFAQEGTISHEEALARARDPSTLQVRLERNDRDDHADGPLDNPFPVKPDQPPPELFGHADAQE